MVDLAENFRQVNARIAVACLRRGRNPATVQLLAVTKTHPPEVVEAAARLGQLVFGENRVQEAKAKIPLCSARLEWHLIGHLQTNKCRDAVQIFSMIQSVDRMTLAAELNKWGERISKQLPILLEINVAGESTKFGFKPEELLNQLPDLARFPRLLVRGLMMIAPWSEDPERARPFFARLRQMREECEQRLGAELPVLSMGMSHDLEIAVEEGATLVRVGTVLFGPRQRLRDRAETE